MLTASKFGKLKLVDPEIEKKQTVIDAIGNLPPIQHGESHPIDRMHMSSRLSTINLARIEHSVPGGTWRDWPSNLLANCHQKATGESYLSVYGRMQWNVPSPTLTTQFYGYGNGRFGHPEQSRAISLREGAILQGFPQSYLFVPDNGVVRIKSLGRLIGNAVPVTLARIIGKSIIQHFCEHGLI